MNAYSLPSIRQLLPLLFLVIVVLPLSHCSYRLDAYADLLVGEAATADSKPPDDSIAITYLGTNGYLFESGSTAIVVDPYFTRESLRSVALNGPLHPDEERIAQALAKAQFPSTVDAWLITHAHFDHLLDVPTLQKRFGGKIVTSTTGKYLCEAVGVDPGAVFASDPGSQITLGNATITVLASGHDRVFGQVPYPGKIDAALPSPPHRPRDWKLGTPLAFLVELGGKRIYIESGGIPETPPDPIANGADLAIMGVAVGDSQKRYPDAILALNPRFILPSHQDDFFLPLDRGFHFGPTTNFPRILACHQADEDLPGEMILMDFFSRWIIP